MCCGSSEPCFECSEEPSTAQMQKPIRGPWWLWFHMYPYLETWSNKWWWVPIILSVVHPLQSPRVGQLGHHIWNITEKDFHEALKSQRQQKWECPLSRSLVNSSCKQSTPNLSVLKQALFFYYITWFLWVRNWGRARLGNPLHSVALCGVVHYLSPWVAWSGGSRYFCSHAWRLWENGRKLGWTLHPLCEVSGPVHVVLKRVVWLLVGPLQRRSCQFLKGYPVTAIVLLLLSSGGQSLHRPAQIHRQES